MTYAGRVLSDAASDIALMSVFSMPEVSSLSNSALGSLNPEYALP